jgi:hypothetical protein
MKRPLNLDTLIHSGQQIYGSDRPMGLEFGDQAEAAHRALLTIGNNLGRVTSSIADLSGLAEACLGKNQHGSVLLSLMMLVAYKASNTIHSIKPMEIEEVDFDY